MYVLKAWHIEVTKAGSYPAFIYLCVMHLTEGTSAKAWLMCLISKVLIISEILTLPLQSNHIFIKEKKKVTIKCHLQPL